MSTSAERTYLVAQEIRMIHVMRGSTFSERKVYVPQQSRKVYIERQSTSADRGLINEFYLA